MSTQDSHVSIIVPTVFTLEGHATCYTAAMMNPPRIVYELVPAEGVPETSVPVYSVVGGLLAREILRKGSHLNNGFAQTFVDIARQNIADHPATLEVNTRIDKWLGGVRKGRHARATVHRDVFKSVSTVAVDELMPLNKAGLLAQISVLKSATSMEEFYPKVTTSYDAKQKTTMALYDILVDEGYHPIVLGIALSKEFGGANSTGYTRGGLPRFSFKYRQSIPHFLSAVSRLLGDVAEEHTVPLMRQLFERAGIYKARYKRRLNTALTLANGVCAWPGVNTSRYGRAYDYDSYKASVAATLISELNLSDDDATMLSRRMRMGDALDINDDLTRLKARVEDALPYLGWVLNGYHPEQP